MSDKYPREMYPIVWKHRTNKGRVVYNRSPGRFTYRDLLRVCRKLEYFDTDADLENSVAVVDLLKDRIESYSDIKVEVIFGGGQTGGGGASGTF